jgi:seryl-tRNA synthetase
MSDDQDLEAQTAFFAELTRHGHIIPTNVPGIWGRGPVFERVLAGFESQVFAVSRQDGPEQWCFPPLLSRHDFETSEFIKSFPQLAGSVWSFIDGTQQEALKLAETAREHKDWSAFQKMTQSVLTPAACYPVYPSVAAAGPLPPDGRMIELVSWCFRHEPSPDPARMQAFRVHEVVRIADAECALAWRDMWIDRGPKLFAKVGLPVVVDVASDPFFGRGGKLLAVNQKEAKLKFEVLCPITSKEKPTAIMSFNFHQDHFGTRFGIKTSKGEVAQTACLGFGLERIVLALFATHGCDAKRWPADVRAALAL